MIRRVCWEETSESLVRFRLPLFVCYIRLLCLRSWPLSFFPLFLFIFARRPLGQKSVSGFIIQAPSFIYNSCCWCLLSRKLKDESGIFDFLLVKMYFLFFFPGVSWSRWRRSFIRGESSSTVWSFSSDLLTNTNAHQPITVNGRTNWANHMHLSLLRVFFFFF